MPVMTSKSFSLFIVLLLALTGIGASHTLSRSSADLALQASPEATPQATPAAGDELTVDFDGDSVDEGATDFVPLIGEWVIQEDDSAPSQPNVYAQVGTQDRAPAVTDAEDVFGDAYTDLLDNIETYELFPSTILDGDQYTNLDLSVSYRPISGTIDQLGGLIFRATSPTDYYVWRCNVLEQDCRLFLYEDGKRTSLYEVTVPQETGEWRRLRVVVEGDRIQGFLDDEMVMDFEDSTFQTGYVGLWTKADAVTQFDDFTVIALP